MRAFLLVAPAMAILGLTGCSPKPDEPIASTYQMGDRVPVGSLTYTVFERRWMAQAGAGVDARIPLNRFYLIRINAVNNGSSAVIIPAVSLVDDTGTAFPELPDGDGFPDFLGTLRMVGPAQASQGNLAFDVPPKHYKLKLTDEDGKQVALVDLPLSFDSDVPDITTPLVPDSGGNPTKK